MRSLSGRESRTTRKSLPHSGRLYASDRAMASPFVQEYAKIRGRKCDKDSRKVVNYLRCPRRYIRTTPRQYVEEAFIPSEHQQALSHLKAGTAAGHDGIATDLRHMSSKGSSVLLKILDSSWLSSWGPQFRRTAYVVPFLKEWRIQQTWEVTAQ